MKRIVLPLLLFFLLVFPQTVLSQDTTYTNYRSSVDEYRKTKEEFLVAESKHKTFESLTTQTRLIAASKSFFSSRNSVLSLYLTFLSERVDQTSGLTPEQKEAQQKKTKLLIETLQKHQEEVEKIQNLKDIDPVSSKFDTLFKPLYQEANTVRIYIISGRTRETLKEFLEITQRLEEKTQKLKAYGKKVELLETWISRIKEKTTEVDQNLVKATGTATVVANQEYQTNKNLEEAEEQLKLARENLKKTSLFFKEFLMELKRVI